MNKIKEDKNNIKSEPVLPDQTKPEESNSSLQDDPMNILQQRIVSLEDQLKRALADYQNLEKRVSESRYQLSDWASAEIIRKLLPALNHLEIALKGVSDEEGKSSWFKGVKLSASEFKNVLISEGLEEIDTNSQFDPNQHEAVDMKAGENGIILEVLEKGYNLRGKVLEPAKVIVGKKE